MSAFGPKRASGSALHISAFGNWWIFSEISFIPLKSEMERGGGTSRQKSQILPWSDWQSPLSAKVLPRLVQGSPLGTAKRTLNFQTFYAELSKKGQRKAYMIRRIAHLAGTRLIRFAENRSPWAGSRPSILVVSIPKSGTVYLQQMFAKGLGLVPCIMSNQYFPRDQLHLDAMRKFARGGIYVSAHIDPSAENLQVLNDFVPKWVVHFRDPRSVLLSWVHHVTRYSDEGRFFELLRVTPAPPRDLHAWTLEKRVDWHVDNFLPAVNQWMLDWLGVASQMPQRILITEFAVLKEREQEHAGMILEFFGIDRSRYRHRPPEKTMRVHFRTGSYDEWRDAFTPSQLKRVNGMISPILFDRFNWPEK